MLYPSIISLFTFSYDRNMANKIINDFESKYKNWVKNKYFKLLPKYKKIVLLFLNIDAIL